MDPASHAISEGVKNAMAHLAGAVSIVTVGQGAERNGLTVTSMTCVSMDPPTLLFCINRHSSSWPVLQRTRCFAVNVLGEGHKRLADQFAGRMGHDGPGRYEGAPWRTLATGAPILTDALVAFDCEIERTIPAHSHEIVIGKIRETLAPSGDGPLIYWRRRYEDIFRLSLPPAQDLAWSLAQACEL
jgi:flavin reductase (DIM6/NTAB) family NADH-FMN oxidoreductase RutF